MIDSVEQNIVAYTDTTAQPLQDYFYTVFAFDAVSVSDSSNESEVSTELFVAPASPTNLSFVLDSNEQRVTLTWEDNSLNEKTFEIERAVNSYGFQREAVLEKNKEVYIKDNILYDSTFTYRVRAINKFGASAYTEAVTLPVVTDITTLEEGVSVFPNPAQSVIYINNKTGRPISVLSLNDQYGRSLRNDILCTGFQLPIGVRSLPQGLYVLQLMIDGRLTSIRFVKSEEAR